MHHLFEAHLPASHPDIDGLMREGFVLPSWHPDIAGIVRPRSQVTSPGAMLGFAVAAVLLVIVVARSITKWRNSLKMQEVTVTKSIANETIVSNDSLSDSLEGSVEVMRRERLDVGTYEQEDRVLVYKEKKSSWKTAFGRRVVGTGSHSAGEAALLAAYVLINAGALLASPDYSLGVGFGSLSAGNVLFVFLTAARNSVLTWLAGITFDQLVVYHRFFGRLTVLLGLVHSCFYFDDILNRTSDSVTVTGLLSLGFGVVIVCSSLNYFRRKYFNFFFWSHYAFVGFVVALGLHAPSARPLLYASVGCYVVDKSFQMVWKMPTTALVFKKVDERTVHVRFAKSPLSNVLRRHKCGQYFFLNIPSMSLQEWHVSLVC